jgi:hypothetical protein
MMQIYVEERGRALAPTTIELIHLDTLVSIMRSIVLAGGKSKGVPHSITLRIA